MYTPVFTRPPQSWRDWWSAVREFAAGWYGIAAGDVTGYDREVRSLERQLGMSLSPSIHEWAAFATDLHQAGVFSRAFNGDRFALGWNSGMQAVTLLTCSRGTCAGLCIRRIWAAKTRRRTPGVPPASASTGTGGTRTPPQPASSPSTI